MRRRERQDNVRERSPRRSAGLSSAAIRGDRELERGEGANIVGSKA